MNALDISCRAKSRVRCKNLRLLRFSAKQQPILTQQLIVLQIESPMWAPTKIITPSKTYEFPLKEGKYNYPNSAGLYHEAAAVRNYLKSGKYVWTYTLVLLEHIRVMITSSHSIYTGKMWFTIQYTLATFCNFDPDIALWTIRKSFCCLIELPHYYPKG